MLNIVSKDKRTRHYVFRWAYINHKDH